MGVVEERNPQSVDWRAYFSRIKPVCPWSWAAWGHGEIWLGKFSQPLPLDGYRARVYHFRDITPRRLKKIAKQLDTTDPTCEWLWSHPRYRHNSTPVPVLIQQDRLYLNQLRTSLTRPL